MDFSGVWTFDQAQVLDDKTALARGHVLPNGLPALHGTWTRVAYFRIRQDKDFSLTVFDDDGHIARFASEPAPLSWSAIADSRIYSTADGDTGEEGRPAGPNYTCSIVPSLVLSAYSDLDAPSGFDAGDIYVSHSTDAAAVKEQRLSASKDGSRLTWTDGKRTLTFFPIPAQQGLETGSSFSDTFAGSSEFSQTAFPFYGFNPLKMLFYSESSAFELPGTPASSVAYTDNPGQTFIAPLLFEFPAANSKDYVRSLDFARQPNLPIGRRWLPVQTASETRHTQVVSSVAERMNSWSTTLGLSAGAEGMFSLGGKFSYHQKIETQQQTESRYVVSRSVTLHGINIIHTPSLKLHSAFKDWLLTLAADVASGSGTKPDWKPFVDHFGSHYLHAMTYGSMKFGETRMSLDCEMKAQTEGFDVKATAEGTLDKVNLKADGEYAQEWSSRLQSKVEIEDVACYEIGGPGGDAVGIMYDLRPITELLCPVLIPYNPADDLGLYAPWVWTQVRASLQTYLDELGLGKPLDDKLRTNYRPRIVRVVISRPSISVASGSPDWTGLNIFAGITLSTMDTPDQQKTLMPAKPAFPIMVSANQLSQLPAELTFCVIALRAQAHAKLEVKTQWGMAPTVWMSELMSGDNAIANYRFEGTTSLEVAVPEGGKAATTVGPLISINGARVHDGTLALAIPLTLTEVDG